MRPLTRRVALALGPASFAGLALGHSTAAATSSQPWEGYPTTEASKANAIVGASHARPDRVREMLREDPGLAKSSWDWGFGDWETAIGAASHTGQMEIIEILIAHGARPTLFTLATLDRVDALRDVLGGVRNTSDLEGPHSISLYRHAEVGKAHRVQEYLSEIGISDSNPFQTDETVARKYLGTYAWGPGVTERFQVEWFDRMSCLSFKRQGSVGRNLIPLGDHAFSPAGARHVRIRFEVTDGRPKEVAVPWAGMTVKARRVD